MEMKTLQEIKSLTNAEQIKAYSDPYRIKILKEFYKLKRPATVKEIADIMEEVPAKVYYHVKKLEKSEILVLNHTKEINGIVAKFYEPTAKAYNIADEELANSTNMVMRNETEKLIHNLYKYSEKTFLESLRKLYKNDMQYEVKSEGRCIVQDEIYLTEKEIEKFEKLILKFIEEHGKSKQGIDSKKYHFFTAFIKKMKDDDK